MMYKYVSMMVALPILLVAEVCNAQVWEGGGKTVTALRFGSNGVSVQFNPAPAACNGGNNYRMHAHLYKDHPNYNSLLSALITLKTTKTPLQHLWLSDEDVACSATHILKLESFEY